MSLGVTDVWVSFRCDTCRKLLFEERITSALVGNWEGVSMWWLGQIGAHLRQHAPAQTGQLGGEISDLKPTPSTDEKPEKGR